MKRVLVTGGTGALGRAVIAHLRDTKAYDIFTTSARMTANDNIDLTVLPCDVRHPEQLKNACDAASPSLILHLAAAFTDDLSEAYRINVAPASHLLEHVYKREMKTRVILIGSAAEYGMVKREENPIREDHVLSPVSVYGTSKAWQTQLLDLYKNRGVDVICSRIFNLYGPGISERLFAGRIFNQMNAVKREQKDSIDVGALTAIRDYISTDAAAQQLLIIAEHGISGHVYHIGSGEPITMRDFLIHQLKLNGLSPALIREEPANSNRSGYDVPMIYANMQKTRKLEDYVLCQS
jgi:nucleoside-diphosphate-sugar epimerase